MSDKINLREAISKAVKDQVSGGLADDKSCEDIAKKHGVSVESIHSAMKQGVKVEMEHTDDPKIAKEITRDHLMEDPEYYRKLKKMEAE